MPTTQNLYTRAYEARRSANAAQRAEAERLAEEQAAEQLRLQRSQTADQNRQLYSDYMHNLKTLPQELAAQGITGGLAETNRVRLATDYSGRVNANEAANRQAERDIQTAAQDARYKAAAAETQANAQAEDDYYTRARQDAAESAKQLAAAGDYSGYVAMGLLTEEQAALLRQAWIAQNGKLAQALGYVKPKKKTTYKAAAQPAAQPALGAPAATGGQVAQEWR